MVPDGLWVCKTSGICFSIGFVHAELCLPTLPCPAPLALLLMPTDNSWFSSFPNGSSSQDNPMRLMAQISQRAQPRLFLKVINSSSMTRYQRKRSFHTKKVSLQSYCCEVVLFCTCAIHTPHTHCFTIRKSPTGKSLTLNYELSDSGTVCA